MKLTDEHKRKISEAKKKYWQSIEQLGYNCQLCGTNKNVKLHHKDSNAKNNNIDNWQRLCGNCHNLIHLRYFNMTESEKSTLQNIVRKKCGRNWLIKKKHIIDYSRYPDYYTAKETLSILGITRQRLSQIRARLLTIRPINGIHLYEKKSVNEYKSRIKQSGRPLLTK